jgi:putative endonuclease
VRQGHQYWVYIATNGSKTLYTGITNDLPRRMYEHRNSLILGFTSKYRIDRLVYFEVTSDVRAAIEREKQIKGWKRNKKIALIEGANPRWKDLSEEWSEQILRRFAPQNDKRERLRSEKEMGEHPK